MISYPIAFPSSSYRTEQLLGYEMSDVQNISLENYSTQLINRSGQRLTLSVRLFCTEDESREVELFIKRMKGYRGSTRYPLYYKNQGTGLGSIVVSDSGSPLRETITLDGGTGSNCIAAGDWIQVGEQAVSLLETYSGSVQSVAIMPCLHGDASGTEPISFTNPTNIMRLRQAKQDWSITSDDHMVEWVIELEDKI